MTDQPLPPLPLLQWCEESPCSSLLRARLGNELVSLTPRQDGSWADALCGANSGANLELRGLTAAEARGSKNSSSVSRCAAAFLHRPSFHAGGLP